MLAQKERGLKLSEQFDEKILQVLTRVSYSALEIPLYAWAHARRNWSVMRRTTLKLQPHRGGGGGGGGGEVPSLTHAQYAVWHIWRLWCRFCNMGVLWDRVVSRPYRGGGKFEACLGGVGNLNC